MNVLRLISQLIGIETLRLTVYLQLTYKKKEKVYLQLEENITLE